MRSVQKYIFLLVLIFIYQGDALAMYKCTGSNGKVSFTDTAVSSSCVPMDLGDEITVRVSNDTLVRISHRFIKGYKANKYERFINLYGVKYNVDPHLIRAVIRTESAFNPKAVSKKGAQGLMQLMPGTSKALKVRDPFDPRQNIEGGTRYLRSLLTRFSEDTQLALAAYNAGPTAVKREKGIPRYRETQNYVKKVLRYYNEYKNGQA